jgi:hypothetical protein
VIDALGIQQYTCGMPVVADESPDPFIKIGNEGDQGGSLGSFSDAGDVYTIKTEPVHHAYFEGLVSRHTDEATPAPQTGGCVDEDGGVGIGL